MVINDIFSDTIKCDFLLVTEHWQSQDSINVIKLKQFSLCTSFCRTNMKHGGVAIYKSDDFSDNICIFKVEGFCIEGVFESCCIKIPSKQLTIAVVYRPPTDDFNLFLQSFNEFLSELCNSSNRVVIGGDFNIDILTNSENLTFFKDCIACFNLKTTISMPTRITPISRTCIDNFLINSDSSYTADARDYCLSDHHAILIKIKVLSSNKQINNNTVYRRCHSAENVATFKTLLSQESWDDVYKITCPDKAFDCFSRILLYYYEISFPIRKCNTNPNNNKNRADSQELAELRNQVALYGDLAKNFAEFKDIYKHCNQTYREELRKAQMAYYDSEIAKSNNKTTTWQIINKIQKKSYKIQEIIITENNVNIPNNILAENFNTHFIDSTSISSKCDTNFTDINIALNNKSLFMNPLCENDILLLITKLKNTNSAGHDHISNKLIKECRYELCRPILYLLNASLEKGIFPKKLKLALVTPIYKKGDRNVYGNYRAISVLSSISKIYELKIKEQLVSFFNSHSLLSPSQHGFTCNSSTETALYEFHRKVVSALDRRLHVMGLFVDFSRAFDCVDHELLIYKLSRYGIRGPCLDLLKSYLTGRSQVVKIGNLLSTEKCINRGVPQGSVLGPYLFIIYSNDLIVSLNKMSPNSQIVCYVDDTNILVANTTLEQARTNMCNLYHHIAEWSRKNSLILNETKTQAIYFSMRASQQTPEPLSTDDCEISFVENTKLLGIVIDSRSQWTQHIETLCKKLRSGCYSLNFMARQCSTQILLTIYYASFHCHLRYGILNWGCSTNMERVFLLQKYAVRIIAKLAYRDSCRLAFKNLKILTLAEIYIYEICIYVYKHRSLFASNQNTHEHETRSKNLLIPEAHRSSFYQKNLQFMGCKVFNSLTEDIQTSPNLFIFKQRVKELLQARICYTLEEYFNSP